MCVQVCVVVCVCVEPGGVLSAGSCSLLSGVSSVTWAACLNKSLIPKSLLARRHAVERCPKHTFLYTSDHHGPLDGNWNSVLKVTFTVLKAQLPQVRGKGFEKKKNRKSGKPCGRRSVSKSRHHGVTQFKLVGVNVAADWTWQTSPEPPCLISQPCFVEPNLSPIIWQGIFYFKHRFIWLGLHVSCLITWKVFFFCKFCTTQRTESHLPVLH